MTSPPNPPLPSEPCIAIVGVGLIGGSIAAALRKRGYRGQIIGAGRRHARLEAARSARLIDTCTTEIGEAARNASLIVFCTPVDQIVSGVLEASRSAARGTLITDAGSTKRDICAAIHGKLPDGVTFIGSHPLAGSEKTGFEYADPDLYQNRVCALTPHAGDSPAELARLERFWRAIGMRTIKLEPDRHDAALATTSHLPHVAAAALALCLEEDLRPLAASGFRDTTRIAAGDHELWTAILGSNADNVVAAIDNCTAQLALLRTAIESRDDAVLQKLLLRAKRNREALDGLN